MARIRKQIPRRACIAKASAPYHLRMPASISPAGITKSINGFSETLFQFGFSINDLVPCGVIWQPRQVPVVQRVRTHVETLRKLARLNRRHHRRCFAVSDRKIKTCAKIMTIEHVGNTKIQRMSVIYRQGKA
jgi:hypothetical protein